MKKLVLTGVFALGLLGFALPVQAEGLYVYTGQ